VTAHRAVRAAAILAASLAATLSAQFAAAQGWQDVISVEDGFATVFPGTPTVREIEWDSEYGAVFPGRVYSLDVDGRYYAVTIIDYRDAEAIHLARTNYTEADSPQRYNYWRVDIVASVAYAAAQFRQRGGEVTFDAWHHIDRVPGHQIQLTNDDGSRTYAGIYLHENRLYIVEATVPRNTPPQGMFQQGLRFIDEQGRRIRYDWGENNELIKQTRETVTRE
jgi:hypothetical protein